MHQYGVILSHLQTLNNVQSQFWNIEIWRWFISVRVCVCQQICSFNTNILKLCTLCVSVHYVMLCTGISRENFPCKKAEQSRTDQSSVKLCWDIYIQLRRSKWGGKVKWNWDPEKYYIYLQHFQHCIFICSIFSSNWISTIFGLLTSSAVWPPEFPAVRTSSPPDPNFWPPYREKKLCGVTYPQKAEQPLRCLDLS